MDLEVRSEREDQYVDWKGRRYDFKKHGGIRAACLTCVVEVLENLVFLSNATNFVAYFQHSMHYPTAASANMVTNFMGTSFLFTLIGGLISDSFFTRFKTFVLFCTMELLGLVLLTIQSHNKKLQPEKNHTPSPLQSTLLYFGLYSMAIGVGGVKASLPAHGADQIDRSNQRALSAFFNWFFFSLCMGGLVSATVMVWVEENLGWNWSFGISNVVLSLALLIFLAGFPFFRYKLPGGSPLARIFKVLMSTIRNREASADRASSRAPTDGADGRSQDKLKILNKALADRKISATEVEETRTFIGLLPIFASTITMNCCLAQLMTFSVQQGFIMNRTIRHDFKIPTQSLSVLPLSIMLASIPVYEHFINLYGQKMNRNFNFFEPLRRIGLGLVLASGSMAVAAVVEAKRRHAAEQGVALPVFWLAWQYLLLGISDMLTLGGMLEFFYSEAPNNMRSMSTALSWCSTAMGYFLSSALVSLANSISGKFGRPWLGGNNLNLGRLDYYYTLLSILNFINFINYLYWAKRY